MPRPVTSHCRRAITRVDIQRAARTGRRAADDMRIAGDTLLGHLFFRYIGRRPPIYLITCLGRALLPAASIRHGRAWFLLRYAALCRWH